MDWIRPIGRSASKTEDADLVTTDAKNETIADIEEAADQKSFFAGGVLLGLTGGVMVAVLVIGIAGSLSLLVDDGPRSSTVAEVESTEPLTGEALLIATGEDVVAGYGCIGCHTTDGRDGTGPTWSGLAAVVDEEYMRRAILDPNADIAAGFSPDIMPPSYADSLSDEDLDAIVTYLSSL